MIDVMVEELVLVDTKAVTIGKGRYSPRGQRLVMPGVS